MTGAAYTYVQRTGWFYTPDGERMSKGYAGNGAGLNNPDMQFVVRVGPLPVGDYTIKPPYKHQRLGPLTMNLEPDAGNKMRGRAAFRIHGDNSKGDKSASQGCIILLRVARRYIADHLDECDRLRVVAEKADA